MAVLTLISVSVPPRVTPVVYKRSRSFCQKCRWYRRLRIKLQTGAWLYGVPHITCAEKATVSRGTSRATTEQCCQIHHFGELKKFIKIILRNGVSGSTVVRCDMSAVSTQTLSLSLSNHTHTHSEHRFPAPSSNEGRMS